MTAKEILQKAREFIDTIGWIQGNYAEYDDVGEVRAVCSVGAIRLAASDNSSFGYIGPENDDAYYDARVALQRALPGHDVVTWNDTPGRTKEEVLAAFDRAILA